MPGYSDMSPFCIVSQKFRVETDEIESVRDSREWPSFVNRCKKHFSSRQGSRARASYRFDRRGCLSALKDPEYSLPHAHDLANFLFLYD